MLEQVTQIFDSSDFPQRWHCGNWSPLHGWVHIVSDLTIFAAYTAIPCVLVYFLLRRRDVPFVPIFWLFGAFILSCGLGHLVEATIFWQPWYRLSALIKALTALVSWATVLALVPILPRALSLPGLATVNARLESEITERRRAEDQLRQNLEKLQQTNQDLERFSHNIVGREGRVIELKQEVNALLRELGRQPSYLIEPLNPE